MRHRSRTAVLVWLAPLVLGALASGCADHLPSQDLRILQTVPVAKLSAEILWKEYQADKRAADKKYWGKAVEVTGKVTTAVKEPSPQVMFFVDLDKPTVGVQANLLDDRAAATLEAATAGQRVTLRCFCEGLATNVILKSCIKP